MMEIDLQGWLTSVLASWGLVSVADALAHGVMLALLVAAAFLADAVCRCFLLKAVAHLVKRTKATWDDVVFDHKVMVRLSRMVVPVVIYCFVPVVFADTNGSTVDFVRRISFVFIVLAFLAFVHAFLRAVYSVYSDKEAFRDRPLKSLLQTLQVVAWFVGGIIILSELIDKDPVSLLAGLGASAAVLMLIFKDTIMGFVSGVQLSANDMLKVGDWIKVPKYDADGVVTEVTLNTVKVRNWDNTVTTVPPYVLVSDSFQNWNAMRESGGRRIQRAVHIDRTMQKFCTPEMLERFRKISLLKDYIERKEQDLQDYNAAHSIDDTVKVNGRRQTNLGVFRAYLTAYLRSLPYTNQELHNAVDQAVRDERLKTELITNVSHDLKTPITSIITYTDLLSKCPQSDEKAKEYMAVLTEKSTKLARLVEDLIEASKLSSGNITLHPMVLDLGELTAQAIGEYQKEFEENRLQLVLDPDLPRVQAFADGSKTYRVLENLLQNAKKYSAVDSRVYVRVYKQGDFGVFEIKNISAEPLNISPQELTQRFVRGDASRTKEGNGLGLSIAQELCSAQQGKLELLIDGDLFKARGYLPQPKNALPQDTAE